MSLPVRHTFNQRDYGTGTWEGGDVNCDHLAPPRGGRNPETAAKQLTNLGTLTYQYSDVCKKCGAVRIDSQLGAEKLHDCLGWATGDNCGKCYICHMRECAKEIYRILRDDGTLWLNIGDSHNGSGGAGGDYNTGGFHAGQKRYSGARVGNVKVKSLLMVPARLAIALEQDGWYLRSSIPWIKRNAYVEGVFDRPTTKMEYVFMLTKSRTYYYDHKAVQIEYTSAMNRWGGSRLVPNGQSMWDENTGQNSYRERDLRPDEDGRLRRPTDWFFDSLQAIMNERSGALLLEEENEHLPLAQVCNTQASGVPHYATFPVDFVKPFILASTSEKGVCKKCKAPLERIEEKDGEAQFRRQKFHSDSPYREHNTVNLYQTIGWKKTCECDSEIIPATVCDPFSGSGSTLVSAEQLGRHGVGMDLSMSYLLQAKKRLEETELPLFMSAK